MRDYLDMRTTACPRCAGTGREEDPQVMLIALRALREELGWSYRDIATRADVAVSYVHLVMAGKKAFKARGPKVRRMYSVMYKALQQIVAV